MSDASEDVRRKMSEQLEHAASEHGTAMVGDIMRERDRLKEDIEGHKARWHADAKQLAAQHDEIDRLRIENHRLAELVTAADLHHIRLRAGLREALDGWQAHDGMRFGVADADRARRPIEYRDLGGEWALP